VRTQRLAFRVKGEKRPTAIRQRIGPHHRQGEVEPRRAAKRRRMPGIVPAGGQQGRGPGRRGYPDDGADVSEMGRLVEEDEWRVPTAAQHVREIGLGPSCDSDDTGCRGDRRQSREHAGRDFLHEATQRIAEVRGETLGERFQALRIMRAGKLDRGAEAERMFERMKSF
jgi:hypothetical protein